MHYYTCITANYISKARVLAKTLKVHNFHTTFHLVLADAITKDYALKDEPFDFIWYLEDIIGLENRLAWIFKHNVVELCTAVKAAAALKILEETNAPKLVYLDPDIAVFDNFSDLFEILDRYNFALTPHLTTPETEYEAILDNEICALKHGVFNLGFLAVNHSAEAVRFLKWWDARLLEFCYADTNFGIFTDQRWLDLAPAFFNNWKIIRDTNYNVATWNLANRRLYIDENGKYMVDGRPLKFFHFSGYDSGAHEAMLAKYAKNSPDVFRISKWYKDALKREGQEIFGCMKCRFNFYDDGTLIEDEHRRIYRANVYLQKIYPNPYMVGVKSYLQWLKKNIKVEINGDNISPKTLFVVKKIYKFLDKLLPIGSLRRRLCKKIIF